jgi:hypothetical protein
MVDGKMYDIVNVAETHESLIFTCYRDKKDQALLDSVKVNTNQQSDNSDQNNFYKLLLSSIITIGIVENNTFLTLSTKSFRYYPSYFIYCSDPWSKIPEHPPKFC